MKKDATYWTLRGLAWLVMSTKLAVPSEIRHGDLDESYTHVAWLWKKHGRI